ncbi:uncharacterized protein LOC135374019 [Ornithodoros turicata]|uniref:uncharacterized protein LOC135374019 n=1 Tax=Ornithodoros turicata TaxID=34597 RepID=UPI0031391F89
MDGLTYQCLRNLPDKTTTRLNQCWDHSMLPPSWKESVIVPILKQGKPPGFRRNLCCQDSVLDLVSDVDDAAQRKCRTAVVFFDIKAAFDSVPINTVMDSLVDPGIGGKAAAFIHALLSNRSFRVRLGWTLSSPRPQNLGLPQGSILSPLLFNLVMAGLPKALPATTPPLQLSIYADDICLWTNGKDPWKVMKTIQKGVDATTEYIRGLGLTPSAEKTRVMLLGSRSSWAPLVKDLQTRCKTTLNVTKRLSGRHSGCPQRTLLTIHNATTAARMLFGPPYAKPSRSALESLELLHRRGLKLALGRPPRMRNVAVYAEAAALPLQLRATQHLLNQLTRLNRTTTGRALLQRLRDRQRSRFSCTLFTQDQLFQPIPPVPSPDAPWRLLGTAIRTTLPGLPRKKDVPDAVAQFLAAERLHESYQDYLHVYTDASVDPGRRACSLACHIPATQFSWTEGLSGLLSSTDAELLAITEALDIIAKTSATKAVILTDSRGALSRLDNRVSPSVLVGIERRLQRTPASYLLRGLEIKYRTLAPNQSQVIFDDLYSERVPSKLTVLMVRSEAYQGNRQRNPFKLENFKLERAVLDVGGQQYTDDFDFQRSIYSKGYMNLLHKLKRKDIPLALAAYEKETFMLYYHLTPDVEVQSLSPVVQANVRLTLTFGGNLTEAVTVLFVSETPRVLEINKDRRVKFV